MASDICCDLAVHTILSGSIDEQLKRRLGQSLVITFDGPDPNIELRTLVENYHVGSIFLTAGNFRDASQAARLIRNIQEIGQSAGDVHPQLIAIQQESGLASHFSNGLQATQFPSPLGLAAGQSTITTHNVGEAIGRELASVGINWNFAPVIDVLTDLTEPLDASRRFGDATETVGDYALAFTKGLHSGGVASCVTEALGTLIQEVYRRSLADEELDLDALISMEEGELYPLQQLIENESLDSVLLSSSIYDLGDTIRGSQSVQFVIQHILRGRLGFTGPVISDCSGFPLDSDICVKHAPLRALLSGSDMVKLSSDYPTQLASIQAIYAAAQSSRLSVSTIASTTFRTSTLRFQHLPQPPFLPLPTFISSHSSLALAAYRASITVLTRNPSPLLLLPQSSILLLLTPTLPSNTPLPSDPFEPLGLALSQIHSRIRHVPYTLTSTLTPIHVAFLQRCAAVVFVLCNTSSALIEAQEEVVQMVEGVLQERERVGGERIGRVVLGAGDPREVIGMDSAGWWGACCYESTRGALETAAEVVMGVRQATGRIPIRQHGQ
ncbi:hypothetical protein MMC12_003737 [Toensbergia leucococca]|nr:hypothetical protein [Toensbergia leucococca]